MYKPVIHTTQLDLEMFNVRNWSDYKKQFGDIPAAPNVKIRLDRASAVK